MSVATQLDRRRFAIVEEVAKDSRRAQDKVKITLDDIEAMTEEFVRSCRLFRQNYDRTKARLFQGEIGDPNAAGNAILTTIQAGLNASQMIKTILVAAREQGRRVSCEQDFDQANGELAALKTKVEANWPFVDKKLAEESLEAYQRGDFVDSGDLLNAQSQSA